MGLGFYGRSFTVANPNCMQPGCEPKEGALGGECTGDVCRAYYLPPGGDQQDYQERG